MCPCEDVIEEEVRLAIEEGYADIESLKRYTGLATGPCQGKSCLLHCRRLLMEVTDADPVDLGTITYRPPIQPVELGKLAADGAGTETVEHPGSGEGEGP